MAVRSKVARGLMATAAIALALTTAACTSKAANTEASAEGGDLASVNVALVPGGSHPYFQPWKAAGELAVTDFGLGSSVFNETAEWDQAKQNEVINSLAAQGVNAFGIFGVSPTDINTTFKTLKEQGFAVGSLASCPAGDVNEADFCLSTDTEVAAYKAAQAAIEAMGGKGNLVHLTGNNVDSNTQRRIAGVEKAVDETNGAVTLLSTVTDIDVDLGTAQKAVADLLAAKGSEINGFVSTAYNPAVASASAVKESGLPIKVVAIDDDQVILDGIADGSVSATVVQNPTGQAYVGSWVLAQLQSKACTVKDPGVIVDSGSFVVTGDNVGTYTEEQDAESEKIMGQFENDLLDCK
ncbi:sugar ABC transporter substrate-binding protein [Agromyces aureus]|uniref:Sugar ABC transporter substrate-binding protein n=1 Tax=Agromyces aureus TaxID=453304 RepID=A0A191WH57_9MICO|nr:substrate-binding domain-containing protein [Agromyces aureus]ANJ27508.1 sugar ABC transporter substrate-binding protein [Agromyces aureus]